MGCGMKDTWYRIVYKDKSFFVEYSYELNMCIEGNETPLYSGIHWIEVPRSCETLEMALLLLKYFERAYNENSA